MGFSSYKPVQRMRPTFSCSSLQPSSEISLDVLFHVQVVNRLRLCSRDDVIEALATAF